MNGEIEFLDDKVLAQALAIADAERRGYNAISRGRITLPLQVFDVIRNALDCHAREIELMKEAL